MDLKVFFLSVLSLSHFFLNVESSEHDFWPFLNPLYQKSHWQEWKFIINNSTSIGEICKQRMSALLSGNNQEWALKMLDSWGKIPAGLGYGSNVDLGQFDECLSIENESSLSISGQYCIASFPLIELEKEFPSLNLLLDSDKLEQINRIKLKLVPGIISPTNVYMGTCLPDECSPFEIRNILNSFILLYYNTLNISVGECQKVQSVSLTGVDIFALVMVVGLIILGICCTIYDVTWPKERGFSPYLVAFSISNNAQQLLGPSSSTFVPFNVLHGLRFFSMTWVVMSHRYLFQASQPSINFIETKNWIEDLSRITLANGDLASDTFFVISGTLLTYYGLKDIYKTGKFDILNFYLHRYIRITPPFAMMILTQATLWNYLGSGPLWPALSGVLKKGCEDNWWTSLLYINNFNPTHSTFGCIPQSWYLSVDMQLHWLSPIILIPLWKYPKLGFIIAGILIIISFVIIFSLSTIYEIPGGVYSMLADPDINFTTFSRFGPFVIGMLVGNFILKSHQKDFHINKILLLVIWLFCLILGLGMLLSVYPFHYLLEPTFGVGPSFHLALNRQSWSLFIGWVIFACSTDKGGIVNAFLSWDILVSLSKLSYCIFLTSFSVQSVLTFVARTSIYNSDYVTIPVYLGDMTISAFLSVVWTLLFEVPFINISKLLFKKNKKKKLLSSSEL